MRKLKGFRSLKSWAGKIKGFYCEIICWWPDWHDEDRPPIWNYYITIDAEQLPNNFESFIGERRVTVCKYTGKEKVDYGYCDVDVKMAGGMTFYEPSFNDKGEIISVKIGCDYNHSGGIDFDLIFGRNNLDITRRRISATKGENYEDSNRNGKGTVGILP